MLNGPRPRRQGETLAEAFWEVVRCLRHTSTETLARWGVTPAQARALRVLARHGTMRLKDLSGHLNISPRSGTEVVDELARRDLVRRTPDPADRRAVLVELTAEGERVSVAMRSARATDAERTFERLTDQDRADLLRILNKLRD
ncbi:MAG TPA: MarR family transcriptional regulator [Pedococcus sp.]|jgi:DNA-binding MarR family transcriptional regulator|nr:MarR family transcriptional regulator [Pedococcus sp.]